MNKSSVKHTRSTGKARVADKKPVKGKSARRAASATAARTVAKSVSKPPAARSQAAKTTKVVAAKRAKAPDRAVATNGTAVASAAMSAISAQPRPAPSPAVQPMTPPPAAITTRTHKFQVGQTVYYNAPTFGRAPAPGNFTVVKLLPSEGDEHQYRIKSNGEAFERVAKESQLEIT